MGQKFIKESFTILTEMVMPNDTNALGHLMGGNLLRFIDIAGAISAQKHSNQLVVTASVDNVSFDQSIPLGNVVTIQASVTRAFSTSMEVMIDVYSENIPKKEKAQTHKAFMTFVAIDSNGKPSKVPQIIPETDEEKENFEKALKRRQFRLLLAGRLKPQEAIELKTIFENI